MIVVMKILFLIIKAINLRIWASIFISCTNITLFNFFWFIIGKYFIPFIILNQWINDWIDSWKFIDNIKAKILWMLIMLLERIIAKAIFILSLCNLIYWCHEFDVLFFFLSVLYHIWLKILILGVTMLQFIYTITQFYFTSSNMIIFLISIWSMRISWSFL